MKKILSLTLPAIITYLVFAFVQAEINSFEWDINIREGCAIVSITSTLLFNINRVFP